MPNEAEQELIVGVMTSDWLGCGLVGHERAQNDWLWSKVGTLWNMEHKKPDSLSEQSARNNSHAFNAQGLGASTKKGDSAVSGGKLRL